MKDICYNMHIQCDYRRNYDMNMMHVATSISLINANSTLLRNINKNKKIEIEKNKNVNNRDAFLQEMFEKAWEQQEKRLSGLKIKLSRESYGHYGSEVTYKYKNGQEAKFEACYCTDGETCEIIQRYDENGNCIKSSRREGRNYSDFKSTFYPNSTQEEFRFLNGEVKHFDKNGNEDTKTYYLRKKIAAKRIKEEEKSNVTLKKASKIEKAISMVMVDKPEMTLIEKMLMRKAKKRE